MIIITNETGHKIMKFSDDFDKYARDILHISNPFIRHNELFKECCRKESDGTLVLDIDKANMVEQETKAEREEWIRLREQYVADRILRELGYEALEAYRDGEYTHDVIPCSGASRQCNMNCKYFGQNKCPTLI